MTGMVKRAAAVAASGLALGGLAAARAAAGPGDDERYLVRAVFDNASFVISGEDVKVGGVKVGTIADVDLTRDNKAAVVLQIDDPAFRPFRADAHCSIRLQSLIGEQFVECVPTRSRPGAASPSPPLRRIERGDGEGQHLLDVEQTTTPVGVDLLNEIMRLPERERFRLIIAELGAGLAANGDSLRAALRRASPALAETNRVIEVLAGQNRLLARLVDESDRVLRPWARTSRRFAGFFRHAGATAAATAERGEDLEENFRRFPAFLRELGPAADRFGALADEMTPALAELHDRAPTINESVARLRGFTDASEPAIETLGRVADRGRVAFPEIRAFAEQLRDLGVPLRTATRNVALMASSFDETGGIEAAMRFIYFYTGIVNGEDDLGHYIRSYINAGQCIDRTPQPFPGCEATFDKSGETARASTASGRRGEELLEYLLGDGVGR